GQWMRAKLHLASVFQGNRKSANIHASPGVIRGIPVQVVYWPACHRAARVEDLCHQKRGGLKIIQRRGNSMTVGTMAPAAPKHTSSYMFRVIVAASIGNALEWFDLLVYGY